MATREIWFERWLWSYIPCHWKGWLFVFFLASCCLAGIGLLSLIASWVGHPDWGVWIPFPVVIIAVWIAEDVASDHSRPKV